MSDHFGKLCIKGLSLKRPRLKLEKYFHFFFLKAHSVLEIFKFCELKIINSMTSWGGWAWYKKFFLLNKCGSKHSLVMKFEQQMKYCNRKILIIKFYKKCDLEIRSRSFVIFQESFVKRNLRKSVCWFCHALIVLLLQIQENQLVSKILFSDRGCN